jgi:hypothetical protein
MCAISKELFRLASRVMLLSIFILTLTLPSHKTFLPLIMHALNKSKHTNLTYHHLLFQVNTNWLVQVHRVKKRKKKIGYREPLHSLHQNVLTQTVILFCSISSHPIGKHSSLTLHFWMFDELKTLAASLVWTK